MPVRYQRPIKKSPKSDPQRNLIYRMESEAIGGRQYLTLSKPKIVSLIKSLSRAYHIAAPAVRFNDMTAWAADWRPPGIITFGKKITSKDLLTALHEFAHHLHYLIEPSDAHTGHGPEFMCCYMSVMDTMRFIPVEASAAVCDRYQIEYIRPRETDGLDQLRKLLRGRRST